MPAPTHPHPARPGTAASAAVSPAIVGSGACPFTERFGHRLPRAFAAEAEGMDWRTLVDTYAPSSDHFHLADFSRRPLGRGITAYEAILAVRSPEDAPGQFTARRLTTESCGDVTAMSDMLSRVGAPAEIERFHQYEGRLREGRPHERRPQERHGESTWCTILLATSGRHETWAIGFGATPPEASIAALLNAATRLHLR